MVFDHASFGIPENAICIYQGLNAFHDSTPVLDWCRAHFDDDEWSENVVDYRMDVFFHFVWFSNPEAEALFTLKWGKE